MTKITVSNFIQIMDETCKETSAILEGLRKSLFIKKQGNLLNPAKVEFRIDESDFKDNKPSSEINFNYIISVSFDEKKHNDEDEINCKLECGGKIISTNIIGNTTGEIYSVAKYEFIEQNKEIINKALEEANINKKYLSMNSCNAWQSTLSRFYRMPKTLQAKSLDSKDIYQVDIVGSQIVLKNYYFCFYYDVYKHLLSKTCASIYEFKEKKMTDEDFNNMTINLFDKLYIEVNELPVFWQILVQKSNLKLHLRK